MKVSGFQNYSGNYYLKGVTFFSSNSGFFQTFFLQFLKTEDFIFNDHFHIVMWFERRYPLLMHHDRPADNQSWFCLLLSCVL